MRIRIIFCGTSEFGIPALSSLASSERFEILGVITQPDRPVGRKQILSPSPIKLEAEKLGLKIFQPEKIKDFDFKANDLEAFDYLVVISYGQIIPKKVLSIPKYGGINVHASLLPKYRGAAPIQAAILNGDQKSGITIMKMDAGLDTGPILAQNEILIEANETFKILYDKLAQLGAKALPLALVDFANGAIKPVDQDESKAGYVGVIKKQDGKIDFSLPAKEIERKVRAMNPWPGAFALVKSQKACLPRRQTGLPAGRSIKSLKSEDKNYSMIKILEVDYNVLNEDNHEIGELFLTPDKKLAAQCGEGAVVIKRLQSEGKKPMSDKEFLRGNQDFIGKVLG